jgi:hypothetical protein
MNKLYSEKDFNAMTGEEIDALRGRVIQSGIPSSTVERLDPSHLAIALNNLR